MKLSVAMCTYNGAKYVERQLLSIINQECCVNEIVVCDDGSNDNTLEIVNKIAMSNEHIKWIIQKNCPNLGVIKNFEKAISLCTGEIIFLSDQDDLWYSNKTITICNLFQERQEVNVIFTDADLIDAKGRTLTNHSLLDSVGLLPIISLWKDGLQLEILNCENRATGATMAIRKSFVKEVLPFKDITNGLHDQQLAMIACLTDSLLLIPKRLIAYRQHENNVIGVPKDNWVYTGKRPISSLLSSIIGLYPTKDYMHRYPNRHLHFYEIRRKYIWSLKGKIKLLFLLHQYFKCYHSHALLFYLHDIKYCLKKLIKDYWGHRGHACTPVH